MSIFRRRLTYANVMSTLAVFVALGGTSYAVATGSIGTLEIKDNSVQGSDVRDGTLGHRDLSRRLRHNLRGSGSTQQGFFSIFGLQGGQLNGYVSFPVPLPSPPKFRVQGPGGPVPEGCSGSALNPGASPGYFCLFLTTDLNAVRSSNGSTFVEPASTLPGKPDRWGAQLTAYPVKPGESIWLIGHWAVTP